MRQTVMLEICCFDFCRVGRPGALDINCASTCLMTIFLADILENARHEEKIALALRHVDHMLQLMITAAHSQGWMNMDLGPLGSFTIDPAGNIGLQLQTLIATIHRTVSSALATQWNSMDTILKYKFEDHMILSDLVYFVLRVKKTRKQQGKRAWVRKTKDTIDKLWQSVVKVLAMSCELHVFANIHQLSDKDIPERSTKRRPIRLWENDFVFELNTETLILFCFYFFDNISTSNSEVLLIEVIWTR